MWGELYAVNFQLSHLNLIFFHLFLFVNEQIKHQRVNTLNTKKKYFSPEQ